MCRVWVMMLRGSAEHFCSQDSDPLPPSYPLLLLLELVEEAPLLPAVNLLLDWYWLSLVSAFLLW